MSFSSGASACWEASWMCMRVRVHMYTYVLCMCAWCIYICAFFFAVSVACTLELVFWAPVHVQVYTLYRCFFDINVHICDTLAAGCAPMCICICLCVCMHMYMDTYVVLLDMLRHRWWDFLLCIGVHIHAYAHVCECMRVYVYFHIYV